VLDEHGNQFQRDRGLFGMYIQSACSGLSVASAPDDIEWYRAKGAVLSDRRIGEIETVVSWRDKCSAVVVFGELKISLSSTSRDVPYIARSELALESREVFGSSLPIRATSTARLLSMSYFVGNFPKYTSPPHDKESSKRRLVQVRGMVRGIVRAWQRGSNELRHSCTGQRASSEKIRVFAIGCMIHLSQHVGQCLHRSTAMAFLAID
jgi:hypothetical protein